MSTTVKKYEIALVVDVDGVGEEILSLPIIAKLVHLTLLKQSLKFSSVQWLRPFYA